VGSRMSALSRFEMRVHLAPVTTVFLVIATVWLLFRSHLAGEMTFPWDFQGGYFSHAVARLRDGSFLAPPLWLPWGGFGIPSHMSLQDGAWYIPQYLYAALGTYDVVGATRLQVVHVALGGLGMLALCRSFGLSWMAACLAATGYLYSGSFFSNAQHVDIVRGAALIPWLLYSLKQLWEYGTATRFAIFVVVAWQVIVAAYPGMVVAAAYACVILLALLVIAADGLGNRRLSRVAIVAAGGAFAAGLAAVKYLPALMDDANVRQAVDAVALAEPEIFTTLIFNFDASFLPNDLSMRDLFLAPALVFLAATTARLDVAGRTGLALALAGLLAMVDFGGWHSVAAGLPGMRISRFPLSDFRPLLHVGICMLAAVGAHRLELGEGPGRRKFVRRAVLGVVALLGLVFYGLSLGHGPVPAYWAIAGVALAAAFAFAALTFRERRWVPSLAIALMILLTNATGFHHVHTTAITWNLERNDAIERNLYGDTLRNLVSDNRFDALEHRPARLVFNELPVLSRGELIDQRYQVGWVREGFSAFGYENYKFMPGLRRLYEAAQRDASEVDFRSMQWMLRPSSVIVAATPSAIPAGVLADCEDRVCTTGALADVNVAMKQFRENGAVYTVTSERNFVLVENEAMYEGWQSLVCAGSECVNGPLATAVNGFLRGWKMPAGEYEFITYYQPPGWRAALLVAWSSLGLALLLVFILLRRSLCKRADRHVGGGR
jgi:hypothetical protein